MIDDSVVPFIDCMRIGANNTNIRFKNGSEIRIILASDSARGNTFHLVIVDERIDSDVVDYVLRPTEKLERIKRYNDMINEYPRKE